MSLRDASAEKPLVKTKIIATVGPASSSREQLKALVVAGVDLFRLNFAHGEHEVLEGIVRMVREISAEVGCRSGCWRIFPARRYDSATCRKTACASSKAAGSSSCGRRRRGAAPADVHVREIDRRSQRRRSRAARRRHGVAAGR